MSRNKAKPTPRAAQAATLCMAANALLAAAKFAAAVLGRSAALLSDAADSAADVLTALFVRIALQISAKEADSDHPYGHERFESISSLLLAALMSFGALRIGLEALRSLLAGTAQTPSALALAAALVSVAAKLLLSRYAKRAAARFDAPALADAAANYRTDSASSLFAAVGIAGSVLGAPFLDAAAGCIICIGTLRSAAEIFRGATDALVDRACNEQTQQLICSTALSVPGVCSVKKLLTRRFGNRIYVELEITANGSITLRQAHDIAELVHDAVEETLPQTKHCTVHVEPAEQH